MTNQNDTEMASMITGMHAQVNEQQRCLDENKKRLIAALRATSIHRITINFDGSCDEGCIDPPNPYDLGGDPCDIPDIDVECATSCGSASRSEPQRLKLADALVSLAYDYLAARYGGWEINDGAYGEFLIDVPQGTVTLNYYQRFTDATLSQEAF
jgi:hypothetical protein